MSSSDLTHDNCGNLNLLNDFSKHYNSDLAVQQEILHNSSSVNDDNYHIVTPESFNMHSLYGVISDKHQQLPHQTPPSSNSIKSQSFQINRVYPKPLLPECESNSTLPHFSYSDYNFAYDILSNAPHFPASRVFQALGSNQSTNIDNIYSISKNFQQGNDTSRVRDEVAYPQRNSISGLDQDLCLNSTIISELDNIEETTAQFWGDLQKRWQVLAKNDMDSHPWLVHRIETECEMAYQFTVSNEQENDGLMEKGISMLSQGQLSSAISLFESELQLRPDNSKAWLYLGENSDQFSKYLQFSLL
ncbi:Peroxisomal biogenesis factor 5 isoform X4 [Oopsacas minuta]|uniref:Peroxisomal biogenesis factor 5 isoform X4 n=1 Tax=Oopsacas minuta TaxID=111878 RepID=A0AAV7K442_9METZ|nr:Peroxisomal biogenesis factor 5 isoform X4 [Oopsacas minuta]